MGICVRPALTPPRSAALPVPVQTNRELPIKANHGIMLRRADGSLFKKCKDTEGGAAERHEGHKDLALMGQCDAQSRRGKGPAVRPAAMTSHLPNYCIQIRAQNVKNKDKYSK